VATGRLILRAAVGGLMMGHGLQKLNGSFGGPGLEGAEKMMGALGLHPAKHQARAAALSETIGGGLTAAGFLSPLGPAMIVGTMAVAIKKVHGKNGIWAQEGGYEYNLTLIAAALALAAEGPGVLSLDGLLRKHRSGLHWAIVAAALGLGGAAATLAVADRMAPTGEVDAEAPPATAGPGTAETGPEASIVSGTA
jgi:putative oxidoreductase